MLLHVTRLDAFFTEMMINKVIAKTSSELLWLCLSAIANSSGSLVPRPLPPRRGLVHTPWFLGDL